jgi:hypothetical protein
MKARVNKVTEPITIVVVNGREHYTVQLVQGDLIKLEQGDLVVNKNEERFHIPDKTMEVIKTIPVPTLEVYIHTLTHGQLRAIIEDGEMFSSAEIAEAVKKAIDENRNK